jgi:hypothetical protein
MKKGMITVVMLLTILLTTAMAGEQKIRFFSLTYDGDGNWFVFCLIPETQAREILGKHYVMATTIRLDIKISEFQGGVPGTLSVMPGKSKKTMWITSISR